MDETKTHYGALPAHRLLFPSRPSCFRERTVPKRPACNPAYQRHGGRARGRCSFDTRVPLRHPRFCKQSRGRYWRDLHHQLLSASRNLDFLAGGPYHIGTQSTPSGCSDVGLVAGNPPSTHSVTSGIPVQIFVPCHSHGIVDVPAGCRMRRWHQWPGPARPPCAAGARIACWGLAAANADP
jgi:hypothetical protein